MERPQTLPLDQRGFDSRYVLRDTGDILLRSLGVLEPLAGLSPPLMIQGEIAGGLMQEGLDVFDRCPINGFARTHIRFLRKILSRLRISDDTQDRADERTALVQENCRQNRENFRSPDRKRDSGTAPPQHIRQKDAFACRFNAQPALLVPQYPVRPFVTGVAPSRLLIIVSRKELGDSEVA